MRIACILLIAVAMASCGGSEPRKPEDLATAWVDAVNERDFSRACDLSIASPESPDCLALLRAAFRSHRRSMAIEGMYLNRGEDPTQLGQFFVSGAPRELARPLRLERAGGRVRVHFEIQAIR